MNHVGQERLPVTTKPSSVPELRRTPTIKEFADAIGVSPTTVSRSITRRGRISDETRQMVLERMEELGYTPNLHAQRLVSRRADTVALCLGGALVPTTDLFLAGLIRGLQSALQECDNGLLILGPGALLKRWVDSRAVDGVIIVGGRPEDDALALSIMRPEVPCVVIGSTPLPLGPHTGSVVIDLAGSGAKVARAFWERGHRTIGVRVVTHLARHQKNFVARRWRHARTVLERERHQLLRDTQSLRDLLLRHRTRRRVPLWRHGQRSGLAHRSRISRTKSAPRARLFFFFVCL